MTVLAEGAVTERDYIGHLKALYDGRVRIAFVPKQSSDPRRILRAAESELPGSSGVVCLIDRDDHPDLTTARERAEREGIIVVQSTPCFELWLALHCRDCTAHVSSSDAIDTWHSIAGRGKTISSATWGRHLLPGLQDACRRARELAARHAANGHDERHNPSSEVWRLIELLDTLAR